jgi:hypothetical protein
MQRQKKTTYKLIKEFFCVKYKIVKSIAFEMKRFPKETFGCDFWTLMNLD